MRYTPDTLLRCSCSNPECEARIEARRGFVETGHPDGSVSQDWDFLILRADDGPGETVELMIPPEEARKLLWFMVRAFCPGITFLCAVGQRIRRKLATTATGAGSNRKENRS